MEDGQILPPEAHVLRLPRPPPDFMVDRWQATSHQFEPSTIDKEHAARLGKPIRVSVWDESLTTIEQARSFRGGPTIVMRVDVRDVLDIADSTDRMMRVVYDHLTPPDDSRPGAEGHAGIEGLERAPEEPRQAWRARLNRLAERAQLVAGPE